MSEEAQYDLEMASLKVPPHSIEAEQSVLGGLMLDNNAWERVLDLVSDGDFYRHDHRLIFRAISRLADRNQPFDVVTLAEQLDKEGQLSQAGGLPYLSELARNTPSVANIKAYAAIIRERATLRQLISISNDIGDIAYNPQGKNYDWFMPYVKLSPNGDFALKGDEWQQIPFSVEILKKSGYEALYIDGRPAS